MIYIALCLKLELGVIRWGIKHENSKNLNPGRKSREMGKSLGREHNFEEVCFEPGTESW